MDTKKDFEKQFPNMSHAYTMDGNIGDKLWKWHLDQMRELAEMFRREEIGCNVAGRYDGENSIIRGVNTKVDLVIKELK